MRPPHSLFSKAFFLPEKEILPPPGHTSLFYNGRHFQPHSIPSRGFWLVFSCTQMSGYIFKVRAKSTWSLSPRNFFFSVVKGVTSVLNMSLITGCWFLHLEDGVVLCTTRFDRRLFSSRTASYHFSSLLRLRRRTPFFFFQVHKLQEVSTVFYEQQLGRSPSWPVCGCLLTRGGKTVVVWLCLKPNQLDLLVIPLGRLQHSLYYSKDSVHDRPRKPIVSQRYAHQKIQTHSRKRNP